jgi:2,4-dienoyl-CoA reductase (NADPH2)
MFDYLFSPVKIGSLELKNRIIMPSIHHCYSPDGFVNDRLVRYYADRAKGGAAMITLGACAVSQTGKLDGMVCLTDDGFIPSFRRLTDAIHEAGAKAAVQIFHGGRYCSSKVIGTQTVSASSVFSRLTNEEPHALTIPEIAVIVEQFGDAARRAKDAGFDAVEVIGSAGYLISQFLSPITNLRSDEYGGSLENRFRFLLEIIGDIKSKTGDALPIIVRIAGDEYVEGGNTNKEAIELSKALEAAGVDAINVTGGWHMAFLPQVTGDVPRGTYIYLAAGVKAHVKIPVIGSNRVNDPALANELIAAGVIDAINMGRPLIADPELPIKAFEGRVDEIRKCIACDQGCLDHIFIGEEVACAINGFCGREAIADKPADTPRKVLVVGGGVAGMEAAIVAARRGHDVTLWEESGRLGGQLHYASKPVGKAEFAGLMEQQQVMLGKYGVKVELNKKADANGIAAFGADRVILAVGAKPITPPFDTEMGANVMQANDVLEGTSVPGKRVVIIGGGAVGCETVEIIAERAMPSAEAIKFLLQHGVAIDEIKTMLDRNPRDITVVEMFKGVGRDIGKTSRWSVIKNMKRLGVKILDEAKVTAIRKTGVVCQKGDETIELPADSVILAFGSRPDTTLQAALESLGVKPHIIGDALKPRKISDAIYEATDAALSL